MSVTPDDPFEQQGMPSGHHRLPGFTDRSETLSQRAYLAVRRAIRDGRLRRDVLYSEGTFARVLEMSRTPVREALIDLAKEGVIEKVPQRGFRLRMLTVADVRESFDLRCLVEAYVVKHAARHVSPDLTHELRRIVGLHDDATATDPSKALAMSEEFHLAIPRMLGLERSYRALLPLRSAGWFSGATIADDRGLMRRAVDEHKAILEAIERGDEEGAADAMRSHLLHTARDAERRILSE